LKYRITWLIKRVKSKIRYYANFRSYIIGEGDDEEASKGVGNIDLRAYTPNPTELIAIAKMLGCKVSKKKNWITTDSENAYFRLIVYAAVRQTLRSPYLTERLRKLVLDEGFDTNAWWWANTFMNKFREGGKIRGLGTRALYRPAKAFKLIYGLAKR